MSKRRRSMSEEKKWIKKEFREDSFTMKKFFEHFAFLKREDGEDSLKCSLFDLSKLTKPKGIGSWAEEKLASLSTALRSNEMNLFWEEVSAKRNERQVVENAMQEEYVYLRTRATTLQAAINKIEVSSHTSDSKGSTFTRDGSVEDEDKIAVNLRHYLLCFDELAPVSEDNVFSMEIKSYDSYELSLEESLAVSSIKFEDTEEENPPMRNLDADMLVRLQHWTKACSTKRQYFDTAKDVHELELVSFLFQTNKNIIDEINGIQLLKNHEEEFRSKHVLPLLQYVFGDGLVVRCDVPSSLYKDSNRTIFSTITVDFTVYWGDIELLCVEVKPFNANPRLVEDDEVRVGEMCKKMLHKRMKNARCEKEFCTFGATISGTNMNLYKLSFDNGEYNYKRLNTITLPTTKATFAFMQLSLCALLGFRDEMMTSVLGDEELELPYLLDATKNLKPTALYLL